MVTMLQGFFCFNPSDPHGFQRRAPEVERPTERGCIGVAGQV